MDVRRLPAVALMAAVVLLVAPTAASAGPAGPVWGSVPSPNRGAEANALLDLDIVAADDIWSVGEYSAGRPPTATGRATQAQHWDGTGWHLVPTPNPSFEGIDLATLQGVSGVATTSGRSGTARISAACGVAP